MEIEIISKIVSFEMMPRCNTPVCLGILNISLESHNRPWHQAIPKSFFRILRDADDDGVMMMMIAVCGFLCVVIGAD